MNSLICFIILLVSLGILTFSSLNYLMTLRIIFKSITSLLFCIQAHVSRKECSNRKPTTYYKAIFSGLFFCMVGDIIIVVNNNALGLLLTFGIISCACGHISYLVGFFQHEKKITLQNVIWFVILFTPICWLLNQDAWFDFNGMKPIVIGYGILICFMVAKSMALWKYRKENAYFVYLTIAAASLFLISDIILLFHLYGKTGLTNLETIDNLIYYVGQGLYGLSFKKELLTQKEK